MAAKRPSTIAEYIEAAPPEGRPHLRQLYKILKGVAPKADEAIKWGNPFFVEPRFVIAFSAHKAHLSLAPTAQAMARFRNQLGQYKATQHMVQVRYDEPLPEALIRKIAEHCVREVAKRASDSFW